MLLKSKLLKKAINLSLYPLWDAIACLRILNKIVFHKKMCFSKLEYIYTNGSKWFNKWGIEREKDKEIGREKVKYVERVINFKTQNGF